MCLAALIRVPSHARKFDCSNSMFGSCSEISSNFDTRLVFTVFGSFPICFSNGDLLSFFLLIRNEYRSSDSPDWSFFIIICLFARNRSFVVRISHSILPFPLWSRTGQVICSIQTERTRYLRIPSQGLFLFFWHAILCYVMFQKLNYFFCCRTMQKFCVRPSGKMIDRY